jgi:hypothetical protein
VESVDAGGLVGGNGRCLHGGAPLVRGWTAPGIEEDSARHDGRSKEKPAVGAGRGKPERAACSVQIRTQGIESGRRGPADFG